MRSLKPSLFSCLIFLSALLISVYSSPNSLAAGNFPSACSSPSGIVYEVGEGKPFTSIGAVPFKNLAPGAAVRIHYRATPYREKISISTSGTADQPICVIGVPGPSGQLPVIDGKDATTSNNMHFDFDGMQQRALVMIMGEDWGDQPQHIHIEGLHLANAHPDNRFTTAGGQSRNYTSNAAAVMVQRGANITLTGLVLTGSGNGFFTAATGDPEMHVRNITLQYSHIYGNGTNSDQHHNIYTESEGMVIQFNRFGPLRSGSGGNNIKDRSAGTIIRYNWIEGGAHLIDLVESEGGYDILSQNPNYDKAWVYGNIMISPNDSGMGRNMIHFGGDLGGEQEGPSDICGFGGGQDPTECYRKGPLYFYNNTVITSITSEDWCCSKTYFRLQTDEQRIEAFNNIFHVIGNDGYVSYMNRRGRANFGVNLVNPSGNVMEQFYRKEGAASAITGLNNLIVLAGGSDTGFVNLAGGDYRLTASSPAVNRGQIISGANLPPVLFEYVKHQGAANRAVNGAIDLGAFEQGSVIPLPTISVPTPQLTVTPPSVELLTNGGFEAGRANNPLRAVGWEVLGVLTNKDRRRCGGSVHSGSCAFRFAASSPISRTLQQVINAPNPSGSNTLSLTGQVSAANLVGNARIRVIVVYPSGVQRINIVIPNGSYGYQPLSQTITLTGVPTQIKVMIQSRSSTGRFDLDTLSLKFIP